MCVAEFCLFVLLRPKHLQTSAGGVSEFVLLRPKDLQTSAGGVSESLKLQARHAVMVTHVCTLEHALLQKAEVVHACIQKMNPQGQTSDQPGVAGRDVI